MPIINNTLLAGAAGQGGGYTIDQSLRFNDDDSAYLSRTFTSAGNRKTWTWSGWVKRGNILSADSGLFCADASGSSNEGVIEFDGSNKLKVRISGTDRRITSQVFRDPSAWYHIVVALDTTQANGADRIKVYVNGSQITSFSTSSDPTQNSDCASFNNANIHTIGRWANTANFYHDGYMAEINFIDGQALAPTDFGEYNDDGMWIPKQYAGTYGTNGFYITGADSADLGADESGNGNDFTSSGLTSDDQVSDSPTLNFPVISPIDYQTTGGSNVTISDGNLTFQNTNTGYSNDARATFALPKGQGKWYFEMEADALGQSGVNREFIGIVTTEYRIDSQPSSGNAFWIDANGFSFSTAGSKGNNGSLTSYGSAWSAGDIIGCAVDLDNNKIWWSINNTWQNSGDPVAGTNAAFTTLSSDVTYAPAFAVDYGTGTSRIIANFGQTGGLTYTPPTGFKALSTTNLPAPTIKDGSAYFNTITYTGDGTTSRTITGVGFQPDLVWIKCRSNAESHILTDAVRGISAGRLKSDSTAAEESQSSTPTATLSGFDADGFVGPSSTPGNINVSSRTYVAWNWLAGNGTATNEDGSTTSTVSANTTAGFSVVTYTGTGSLATVGHGLGTTPAMFIVKRRDSGGNWPVFQDFYGSGVPANNGYLRLNSTAGWSGTSGNNHWNDTSPTSSVFTVKDDSDVNASGGTYVAYCFANVDGFSKIGTYTGNGSADGSFVWCGFRPSFVMIKRADATQYWMIQDSARWTYNPTDKPLFPASNDAESSLGAQNIDFLSNGFKCRSTSATQNASGGTYIFMAFAEHPFGGDSIAPVPAR